MPKHNANNGARGLLVMLAVMMIVVHGCASGRMSKQDQIGSRQTNGVHPFAEEGLVNNLPLIMQWHAHPLLSDHLKVRLFVINNDFKVSGVAFSLFGEDEVRHAGSDNARVMGLYVSPAATLMRDVDFVAMFRVHDSIREQLPAEIAVYEISIRWAKHLIVSSNLRPVLAVDLISQGTGVGEAVHFRFAEREIAVSGKDGSLSFDDHRWIQVFNNPEAAAQSHDPRVIPGPSVPNQP